MDPVSLFLLIMAGILIVGILGEVFFTRTKIPDVLWLVIIGLLLGPVFNIVSRDFIWGVAPFFATLALIVIMFEGGLGLKLRDVLSGAPRGFTLAGLGFLFTMALVALAAQALAHLGFLQEWSLSNSVLLGAILGGSSSIIILPMTRLARLRDEVANVLSIESAVTDTLCVVATIALIGFILQPGTGIELIFKNVAAQFAVGGFFGAVAGIAWLWLLRYLQGTPYAYTLTFAFMLFLYVLADSINGSPAITVLLFGVMLGNGPAITKALKFPEVITLKQDMRGFHDQLSFFIKTFFFVFIGMLMVLEVKTFLIGLVVTLAIVLARPPAVWVSSLRGQFSVEERKLMTIALPRGLAAAVLAVLPSTYGIRGTEQYIGIVFAVILLTILVFTGGFWLFSKPAPKGEPKDGRLRELKVGEPNPVERPPREAVDLESGPENKISEGIREQDY